MPLNALTIDVEEHFHAHAYETCIARETWDAQPSRVGPNTERILALLDRHRVHATFFVLGWVAERHPELIRAIASGGHEIASHGHAHQLIYRQTPAEFSDDITSALGAVRAALGGDGSAAEVIGYRAPAFSLTDNSLWALDILRRHGLRYDSSILPIDVKPGSLGATARGGKQLGVTGAQRFATRLDGGLWEFPVATVRIRQRTVPVAGGGYFRLLPLWVTDRALRRINDIENAAAVVYLHPWEFDPAPPHVPGAPRLAHFRHSINLTKTEARLNSLLERFSFAPIRNVFAAELAHH